MTRSASRALVGDDAHGVSLSLEPHHSLHEVAAGLAVQPGRADHVVRLENGGDGALARQLRAAVRRARIGLRILGIGLAGTAGEDVVRGDLNQTGAEGAHARARFAGPAG